MLFLIGILAACWNYVTLVSQPKALTHLAKNTLPPGVLNFIEEQRSLNSLDHSDIRLPFGPDPNVIKQLPDATFFENNRYQQEYQKGIKAVFIDTVDHRLPDADLLSERNQYPAPYALREVTFQKLNDYWKRKRSEEDRWLQN